MAGVTVALLGDLSVRKELGKVGTQSDIHLHDVKHDGADLTTIVPARYPEQLKCLSYAVCGADAAVLAVKELDARTGEQILAADAAGIPHGIIVLTGHLAAEQLAPLLKGTTLESWPIQQEADWPAVRSHLAATPPIERTGDVLVPIDHHFDVKGVGAVILGVVKQGTLHKGDTLYAWPTKAICPVKSIQIHDADHPEAHVGDRVGLALRNVKADQLDRGQVLAPADADLQALKAGDTTTLRLRRSPFSKQPLGKDSVVHLGMGMQFVPVRLLGDAPGPGQEGSVDAVLEKGLVVAAGDHGVLWHVDAGQRVVASVRFD